MKTIYYTLALITLLYSCSSKKEENSGLFSSDSSSGKSSSGETISEAEQLKYAVCIWDKSSVKEEPTASGKWIASMNVGEKATYLDEEKEDESPKKKTYCKIRLLDGKEGWIQKELIVTKGRPAVVLSDVEIYSRPDLMAKSSKMFSKMDVLAVEGIEGEWVKVAGKRKGGSWVDRGYLKNSNLSYDEKDIALAVYGAKVLAIADKEKRDDEINKLIGNKDFEGSVFINDLKSNLQPMVIEPEEEAVAPVDSVTTN